MPTHYRKDSPKGITPPNPDGPKDLISHITKHRGQKTAYTSVSEDKNAISHFSGQLYKTESVEITQDGHCFITHLELTERIRKIILSSRRAEKVLADRAYQNTVRAKEALIDWQFNLERVDRKERVNWCSGHIQKYFHRV